MKFFIDTANLNEIREAVAMGILDGVTTNPSLIAKEGKPFKETILKICELVNGPVSVEVVATEATGMCQEAHEFAKWHRNVVVKLPTTREGLKACKCLTADGVKTNLTLCFSPNQALHGGQGGRHLRQPVRRPARRHQPRGHGPGARHPHIYRNYGFTTQVLAASLRHPLHVVEAALAGAHVATIPFKVLEQMFKHPLTDRGLEQFLKDWEKAKAIG